MKTPAKYIVGTSTLPFNPATFEEVKEKKNQCRSITNTNQYHVTLQPMSLLISNVQKIPIYLFNFFFFYRLFYISGCVWLIVPEPHLLRRV